MKRYPCRTSARQSTAPQNTISPPPCVQRYAHPIETHTIGTSCTAEQRILCAIQMQTRLLCAIKTELDEILSLLQAQQT